MIGIGFCAFGVYNSINILRNHRKIQAQYETTGCSVLGINGTVMLELDKGLGFGIAVLGLHCNAVESEIRGCPTKSIRTGEPVT